ncbi:MAG: hypothetical protein WCL50_05365 [Spirochaetota bacterium]
MYTRKAALAVLLGSLLMVPVALNAQLSITNGLSHLDSASPGQTYRSSVVVRNNGKENERVKLYLNDYLFFADGSNIFGEPGRDPRSNSSWISLDENEVVIAPGKEHEVPYSVRVPSDTAMVGSYWSLIFVQAITQSLLNPDKNADDTVGVTSGVRFGVQVVTNMGESGIRKLRFYDTKLQKGEESSSLQVSVENTGERKLNPLSSADVYNADGVFVGHIASREVGLYPGTSVRLQFPLVGMAKGRYKAQVVADCGGNDIFGAIYSIELK